MQISIISGSHRIHSESDRIARYLGRIVESLGARFHLVSLAGNPFPLWDEEIWGESDRWRDLWGPTSAQLSKSAGFIVVTPEWGGMVPAGLKNLFLLCQGGELAHKPALITSLSSGLGGANPVNELRTSSYKNTRICYIPEHLIIRTCTTKLKDGQPLEEQDNSLRERVNYSVKLLLSYSKALQSVRDSGLVDLERFPYGM